MDDIIKDMNQVLKKQLVEHNLRTSLLDTNKMELLVTTQYVLKSSVPLTWDIIYHYLGILVTL